MATSKRTCAAVNGLVLREKQATKRLKKRVCDRLSGSEARECHNTYNIVLKHLTSAERFCFEPDSAKTKEILKSLSNASKFYGMAYERWSNK